jgi:large subunit ribosomal protein L7/L12
MIYPNHQPITEGTFFKEYEMADLEKLVDELSTLSVLEAAELVKKLEEKWGVSAAAPVAMAAMGAGPAAAAAPAEPVEEKTEFDVVIKDAGPKKIETIKVIRQLTNLGLKEAKDMAETAGGKVLEAVSKEVAADAKSKLETAGAVIEVV